MATMVDVPGTGESIDLSDPLGAGKQFVMIMLGFLVAISAGAAASKLYNSVIAENTPDAIQEFDLI